MANSSSPFLKRPSTRLGWWAIGLAIAFITMNIVNSAVFMRLIVDASMQPSAIPNFGMPILLCGLASGVVGLIAIIRKHERSWLIWLTILPGALALLAILHEFLVPK